ncbi:MAG: DUF1156 domain-containing protein [Lentisphaeria bacterium]|jgi:adenine-specific DNA methylase/REP element-mobilizing transposase RayT
MSTIPSNDSPRLIEHAFPLKQASLTSVHEKNVRHGHISTLHIWPARRPLAACRAALIATLLPDPGTPEKRRDLCERIGGKVVETTERKKMPDGKVIEVVKEEVEGGILNWIGTEPKSGGASKLKEHRAIVAHREQELQWFRDEIRKAYGGRAPRVLDPFAGGGAIPLEAMRLGCEATAVDINPVAWFILKCTLEYPQKLAGKTHPLPDFILADEAFMEEFYRAHPELVGRTKKTRKQLREDESWIPGFVKPDSGRAPKADLAWHVRAWGRWVLNEARKELATFYPTYAHLEPLQRGGVPLADSEKANGNRDGCPTLAPPSSWANDTLYFNPYEPVDIRERRLPHWTQPGTAFFVTFRLADSIPKPRLEQWRREREAWLAAHPESELTPELRKEYYRLFNDRMEAWLDAGEGECHLRSPQVRRIVADTLMHFDGSRYDLGAWCIMPNHVHALVRPRDNHTLSDVLHSWKSFTAHAINKLLGREGEFWQHESYDHIVRSPQSLWRIEQYIMNNPVVGSARAGEYDTARVEQLWSFQKKASGTLAPPLMRLVPLKDDGTPNLEALNAEFSAEYLADKRNPRWVAKPTVAYLWARTVTCKNCRATVPLLKTRWLCKKANKRVLLTMEVKGGASVPLAKVEQEDGNRDGCPTLVFGIDADVPAQGGNAAQRREHDKRIGAGTMSRAGAQCPCCSAIMTMEDIRFEGKAGRLGMVATAVVTESQTSKAYRLPTAHEIDCASRAAAELERVFAEIPFGLPTEPTPAGGGSGAGRAFSIQGYGLMRWCDLFTSRQLLALGTLVRQIRGVTATSDAALPPDWREAAAAYLACVMSKMLDYGSSLASWYTQNEQITHLFNRFALPIKWDCAETNPIGGASGSWESMLGSVTRSVDTAVNTGGDLAKPTVQKRSATETVVGNFDLVLTDPPYYDAIPYSDCMDFFYVWIKRVVHGTRLDPSSVFAASTSPKWDREANDGELIDDSSRHGGDAEKSKAAYEDGMARAFVACEKSLQPDGRLVIVFAHKHPDAWETLASAIIRAGFIVDGSWPIQTEMANRTRGIASAALASSLWIVCRKRPTAARLGWDNRVLEEMRANITTRLRDFWDAGIRGPDFVWAATGPALEAYSKHPVVKKANDPGQIMSVGEFLVHVRRMVVDFVVGEVMVGQASRLPSGEIATGTVAPPLGDMDSPTAYYLLHRHDFGLEEAPAGACILYATACGISDHDLEVTWDLISTKGGASVPLADESDASDESDLSDDEDSDSGGTSSGGQMRLKPWSQRQGRNMGYDAPSGLPAPSASRQAGRPVPLIDRIHRLMHLWRAGDVHKVDEYLDDNGLRRHELFRRLVQSLIELSERGSEERTLLESLSNHIGARGAVKDDKQGRFALEEQA